MNTIFSAKLLKLETAISGNFDIVEDPNTDPNRTIPVKYTMKKRSEGTLFLDYRTIHFSANSRHHNPFLNIARGPRIILIFGN